VNDHPIPTAFVAARPRQPRLLDRVRTACRIRHYSIRTEEAHVQWALRFVRFHCLRHPREMCAIEINHVLPHRSLDAIRTVPGVIGARRREHNNDPHPRIEPRRPRGEKPLGFVGAEVDTSCGVEPRRSGGEKPLGRVTKNRSDIELRNVH
jgi:hypothetical protein